MTDERLEFYDPLYETIIFEKGLPTSGFDPVDPKRREKNEYPIDPRDLVQTAEFSRLAFLRQAGLAWLVFPSATHTRFAHSIGCWWLGRIAENLIKIKHPGEDRRSGRSDEETRSLKWWLDKTTLREEFYLGLLLHDIGHGPFSHVLEHNESFNSGLRAAGVSKPAHEHRGAALLMKEGVLVETWDTIANQRFGKSVFTLARLRPKLDSYKELCIAAVCFLMTGDEAYLEGCAHSHRDLLFVVKELVSGLLDLDRLDHYARDSYFSGLRQVSVNVRGFLSNLRMKLPQPHKRDPLLSLTHDGASYAASLLFSKRQILSTMFRNPKTVSLHAMANWALTAFLQDCGSNCGRECTQVALMEDDQFLDSMVRSSHPGCRYIARRIRAMQPYALVGRWPKAVLRSRQETISFSLTKLSAELGDEEAPLVLVHFDGGFWASARPEGRDWLDTGHLLMEGTEDFLTNHPDHASDFQHLREAENVKYFWVFAQQSADSAAVKARVETLLTAP